MNDEPAAGLLRRPDARAKLDGSARFVDDLAPPGLLHGITLRSPLPCGRLRAVHRDPAFDWSGFTVVGPEDIPGRNRIVAIADDQPVLAESEIRHAEEPLLLLAHADRERLEAARGRIRFEIEPGIPVLDLDASKAGRIRVRPEGNAFKSIAIDKGDPDPVWQAAHLVLERVYETGAQEQLYLEPQGMIAWADPAGGVRVQGSLQCPYYIHGALREVFGLPAEKVRVIQAVTGGGFGGKEEYPSIIAAHAGLLALMSGRPVKIIYDRAEDLAATTKRHPSRTRHRTAFAADGRLLAMEIEFDLDAGAYLTLSPVVLSRGAIHAAGPYRCDHIKIRATAWVTNTPPHGAFRGFGAPQSCFALERQLDAAAARLGLDPAEIRRRNLLRRGDTTATGQVIREEIDLEGLLDRALQESGYAERRARYELENATAPPGQPRRGVGLSVFFHGAGFTGSGEKTLASKAALELDGSGLVRVLAASTEIGQGAVAVFTQLVAQALEIDPALVLVEMPDTARVPDSGPTVASRTTMVVGGLLERAALELRARLEAGGARDRAQREALLEQLGTGAPLRIEAAYRHPEEIVWDEVCYRGDAYPTYAWAVYVAGVAFDPLTAETRVEDFLALQDVGRVVHPVLAAGQVEGGVAQGIGWALSEVVQWRDGRMANDRLTDYILPTAMDLPPIRALFRETPAGPGPGGAKGLGELPLDGTAPALIAALGQASGLEITAIPALPEDLLPRLAPSGEDSQEDADGR
jgi:CO/xanthine dehydrogenase Mo-binding subunit